MPDQSIGGRALVTRRAVIDIVRRVTLGSYGVAGFAGSWADRLLGWIEQRPGGLRVSVADGTLGDPAPPARRPRPADRRGRAPGRPRRAPRDPDGARAGGRPPVDPRRAARDPPRRRAAAAAGRRPASARPTSPTAGPTSSDGARLMARKSCDGAGLLGAFRAAAAALEASVDEVNALNVFPGPGRRHRLEHDGDRPRRAGRGRGARADGVRGARRRGGGVRRADGRARQLRRDHQPDPARPRRGARRQDEVQRARPCERARPGHEGGVRRRREAGRGHDPDRDPRGLRGGRRQRRAGADARRACMATTVKAAQAAVAKTPSLLADPARGGRRRLRRAGPVPAARGRARLPDRRRRGARAAPARRRSRRRREPGRRRRPARATPQHGAPPGAGMRDEGFGFETMFLAQAATRRKRSMSTRSGTYYESIGESVLVAGDARAIKVHIHNERPDQVLAYALGLGDALEDHDREPRPADERRARDARRGLCD